MGYYGNYKIKCSCGYEGISYQYGDELECPECESKENVIELPIEQWTSEEIVDTWSADLEDANYHSWVYMPNTICNTLEKYIQDPIIITKIMYDLYKNGLQS